MARSRHPYCIHWVELALALYRQPICIVQQKIGAPGTFPNRATAFGIIDGKNRSICIIDIVQKLRALLYLQKLFVRNE